MLAVINADMTFDIEEPQRLAAAGNSVLGQGLAELGGALEGGEASQFASEGFDLRGVIPCFLEASY
jgi:hypothetical protein